MSQDKPTKNILSDSNLNAGGDVNIGDTNNTYNQIFEGALNEVALVDIKERLFPEFTGRLLDCLQSTRFLLIGSDSHLFDVDGFLIPLASLLCEKQSEFESRPVMQFMEFSDLNQVSSEMRKASESTIFLLTGLEPEPVQYDLSRLRVLPGQFEEQQHLLLVSTPFSKEEWRFEKDEENIFWVSKDKVNYEKQELIIYLNRLLTDLSPPIKLKPKKKDQIVKILQTPARLENFARNLKNRKLPENQRALNNYLHEINENNSSLSNWYRHLQEHQSLIALAMSMFSGMYTDQFFAAMDIIIQGPWQYWRNRYRDLEMLDYADISFTSSYFRYKYGWMKCENPAHRRIILKQAWQTHQRSIVAVLPCLIEMLEQSIDNSQNWELYGIKEIDKKQLALRDSLGKTLSEFFFIIPQKVNPYLIRLAANDKRELQSVVAYILAQPLIRAYDLQYEFSIAKFSEKWKKNEDALDQVLKNKEGKLNTDGKSPKAMAYISATMALTLGYIAEAIPPGKLDDEYLDTFKDLPMKKNKMLVRNVPYIFSSLILRHIQQLNDLIRDSFLQHAEYIEPISELLEVAYRKTSPKFIFNTLEQASIRSLLMEWSEYVSKLPRQPLGEDKLSRRGILLCTIARTYGSISYDLEKHHPFRIDMEEAYGTLSDLRKKEVNKKIRKYLLEGMLHLIRYDLEREEFFGIDHISKISDEERKSIEKELVNQYFKGRKKLEPEDEETIKLELPISSNEELVEIHSWSDPEKRPGTKAEKYLLRWLTGGDRILSQIATLSLIRISKFEQIERKRYEEYKNLASKAENDMEADLKNGEKKPYIRDGSLPETEEVKAFLYLIRPYLSENSYEAVRNVSPVLLEGGNVKAPFAQSIYSPLCGVEETDKLHFLYCLFNNEELKACKLQLQSTFFEKVFARLATLFYQVGDAKRWRRLAPLLLRERNRQRNELELIIKWVSGSRQNASNLASMVKGWRLFFKPNDPFER